MHLPSTSHDRGEAKIINTITVQVNPDYVVPLKELDRFEIRRPDLVNDVWYSISHVILKLPSTILSMTVVSGGR